MSSTNYPSSFKQLKNSVKLRNHSENKKLLTRFVFRYRLAKSFSEMIADGIGKTLKGYNAILKVFLAYTAYEQLLRASKGLRVFGLEPIEKNRVINKHIAEKLRSNKELINFLIEYSTDSILIGQLVAFKKDGNDDIVCIAYAIRNIFAHGELTATPIGTNLKKERDTLVKLADELLNYCDEVFTKCVDKLR